MDLLLVYAVTLFVAVLISGVAERSVLSTAVLFMFVGFATRLGGWIEVQPDSLLVEMLTNLALFSVLFTDGMRIGINDLKSAWRLPGRALLLGMPLTMFAIAALSRFTVGLSWSESILLGAALSPTDPVFAAAIIGRQEVPRRLRQLLNVESGINDGLALPVVVIMLALSDRDPLHIGKVLGEVVGGIVIGVVLPWVAALLERRKLLTSTEFYSPLLAFAVGLMIYALTERTHTNGMLAAFAGGMTLASVMPDARDAFHRFGETVAELLKLAALLLFGILVEVEVVQGTSASGILFILLSLLIARPIALGIALAASELNRRERITAAWFGPKGFASMVYGLLILGSGVPRSQLMFHLIACVVGISIVLHSSTDVFIARHFDDPTKDETIR